MIILDQFLLMLQKDPVGTFYKAPDVSAREKKAAVLDKIENTSFFMLSTDAIPKYDSSFDFDVAPPFQTCWFQFLEKQGRNDDGELITDFGFFQNGEFQVFGIFIDEVGPHRYLFAMLTSHPEQNGLMRMQMGHCSQDEDSETWRTVAQFLQPFSKSFTCGIEKTSARLKFKKRSGEKVNHKIKKIIHILPKTASKSDKKDIENQSARIDWKYRWQVRGHWRKKDGIGKNRAGEYAVSGYTYVAEHEKGPEDAPLIKKTRLL